SAATDARGAADKAAAAAGAVGGRVDTVVGRVDTVAADVASVAASARKLIYAVTLSEDQGNFTFGGADLPDEAKARLDQMIGQLKTNTQNVYIELEGHTDNVGTVEGNERLGLDRAESVKRYLYEQHRVPLHKINVISYGEEKPVAPNNTRDGRAQNRRVVVKVLS
ncbi:MAG: oprF, partial [Acidobacteria bacterium]|nr:oprF [Acidobacteriota bacterium]